MNKRNKIILLGAAGVLLVGGIGGGLASYLSDSHSDKEVTSQKQMTQKEQDDFVAEIAKMEEEGFKATEIEKKLKPKMPQLDKKHATQAVRSLVSSMEKMRDYNIELMNYLYYELEYVKLTEDIDNPVKDYQKISNQFAKGYIKEMLRQHLLVTKTDSSYYIETDSKYVLDRFAIYVENGYKEYLNLVADEQKNPIFDDKKGIYVFDRIIDDLEAIDNSRDRWSDKDYASSFSSLEEKLYDLLFNNTHSTYIDITVENEGTDKEKEIYTVKDDMLKKYQAYAEDNSDTTLGKEIKEYVELLKKNKNQITDEVQDYVDDLMDKKFAALNEATNLEESEATTLETNQ